MPILDATSFVPDVISPRLSPNGRPQVMEQGAQSSTFFDLFEDQVTMPGTDLSIETGPCLDSPEDAGLMAEQEARNPDTRTLEPPERKGRHPEHDETVETMEQAARHVPERTEIAGTQSAFAPARHLETPAKILERSAGAARGLEDTVTDVNTSEPAPNLQNPGKGNSNGATPTNEKFSRVSNRPTESDHKESNTTERHDRLDHHVISMESQTRDRREHEKLQRQGVNSATPLAGPRLDQPALNTRPNPIPETRTDRLGTLHPGGETSAQKAITQGIAATFTLFQMSPGLIAPTSGRSEAGAAPLGRDLRTNHAVLPHIASPASGSEETGAADHIAPSLSGGKLDHADHGPKAEFALRDGTQRTRIPRISDANLRPPRDIRYPPKHTEKTSDSVDAPPMSLGSAQTQPSNARIQPETPAAPSTWKSSIPAKTSNPHPDKVTAWTPKSELDVSSVPVDSETATARNTGSLGHPPIFQTPEPPGQSTYPENGLGSGRMVVTDKARRKGEPIHPKFVSEGVRRAPRPMNTMATPDNLKPGEMDDRSAQQVRPNHIDTMPDTSMDPKATSMKSSATDVLPISVPEVSIFTRRSILARVSLHGQSAAPLPGLPSECSTAHPAPERQEAHPTRPVTPTPDSQQNIQGAKTRDTLRDMLPTVTLDGGKRHDPPLPRQLPFTPPRSAYRPPVTVPDVGTGQDFSSKDVEPQSGTYANETETSMPRARPDSRAASPQGDAVRTQIASDPTTRRHPREICAVEPVSDRSISAADATRFPSEQHGSFGLTSADSLNASSAQRLTPAEPAVFLSSRKVDNLPDLRPGPVAGLRVRFTEVPIETYPTPGSSPIPSEAPPIKKPVPARDSWVSIPPDKGFTPSGTAATSAPPVPLDEETEMFPATIAGNERSRVEIQLHGPVRPTAMESSTPQRIAMQVLDAAPKQAGHSVEITLRPEELGNVRMTLQPSDDGMTLNIVAERIETLDLLRRHIGELGTELRDMGYGSVDFGFSQDGEQADVPHRQEFANGHEPAEPRDSRDVHNDPALSTTGVDMRV